MINTLKQNNIPLTFWEVLYRFFARKTSLSTASGLRHALWHVTMLPPVLKTLSEGALVAGMERYFLARLLSLGKLASCTFHHCSGSVSGSVSDDNK